MKWLVYGVAGGIAALLMVMFAMALPEATERARAGEKRGGEAACEVLSPTPTNPVFASFPSPAPDFALKDYAGHEVKLSSLRGNVIVVNFWATWCKTCVVEMPSMEKLVASMQGRPFKLLAVSVDEDWPTIRKFFAHGTPLEIVLDKERDTPKRYGTEKFPESFIIDKEGNVRYFVVSDRDWSQPAVADCLNSLLDS